MCGGEWEDGEVKAKGCRVLFVVTVAQLWLY